MTARSVDNIHAQLGSTYVPQKTRIAREIQHALGTSYYCIGGTDAPGRSWWVDVLTADTAEQAAVKIQGAVSITISAGGPTVSWSAVTGAVSYEIDYGTLTGTYTTVVNVGNVLSYGLGLGLTPGQIYFGVVVAINASGVRSIISDEFNFRVPVAAQQKYVSTTGGGNGTLASPWSFATALSSASAGDTIYLRAGTYSGNFTVGVSGTAGNTITFKPYPGEHVTITNSSGNAILISGKSYVRIEGLEISGTGTAAAGIFITGDSTHIEVVGNEVHGQVGSGSSGIWIEGSTTRAQFHIVTNNYVHDTGGGGITVNNGTGGYIRIEANEVAFCATGGNFDGIQIGVGSNSAHHVVVRRNYAHDNNVPNNSGGDQIDLGGHASSHHYLCEENIIFPNTGHGAWKMHNGGQGSLAAGNFTDGSSGHSIGRFNVIIGTEMTMYEYPNPLCIYNNTFYNPGTFIQHFCNWALTMSLGDSTYATWNTTNSTTDTDTGRLNVKNNLVVQQAASTQYMIFENDNPGASQTIVVTYASVRYQNNRYKFASGSKVNWSTYNNAALDTNFVAGYQAVNAPNLPDTGSTKYAVTTPDSSIFNSQTAGDYQPASGASHIGASAALTKTVGSGSNSTTLVLDRASYFVDGYPSGGERVTIPDTIVIGNQPPVQIVSIGESTNPSVFNVVTIAAPRTWANGDPVKLSGRGVDQGAIDSSNGQVRPLKPTNVSVAVPIS